MNRKEWNNKLCSYSKYFKSDEFKCKCGKCNSPAYLNPNLITYLDALRRHFDRPVIITSGIRCKDYNDSLPGSSRVSGHLKGNAADVYIKGVHPKEIHYWWKHNVSHGFSYYGTSNMGNCVHVEVI